MLEEFNRGFVEFEIIFLNLLINLRIVIFEQMCVFRKVKRQAARFDFANRTKVNQIAKIRFSYVFDFVNF